MALLVKEQNRKERLSDQMEEAEQFVFGASNREATWNEESVQRIGQKFDEIRT